MNQHKWRKRGRAVGLTFFQGGLGYLNLRVCFYNNTSACSGAPRGVWGLNPPPLFFTPNFCFKVKCPNYASAVRAVILTQLRQNLPHIMLKPNRLVGVVVRDITIRAGRRDASSIPAIFKHVFDEYSFFIISNLFDNNKPYALSTHNQKCVNKMHHIW